MLYDNSDRFLNTPIYQGAYGYVPGISIKLTSTYGSYKVEVDCPGSIEAPEVAFSEDIVYYRTAIVDSFNNEEFEKINRYYRGYLIACVALVDSYIHRYNFHVKELIPSTQEYDNTKILDSRKSIEAGLMHGLLLSHLIRRKFLSIQKRKQLFLN